MITLCVPSANLKLLSASNWDFLVYLGILVTEGTPLLSGSNQLNEPDLTPYNTHTTCLVAQSNSSKISKDPHSFKC
jgi:hypothetical protein